MRHLFQRLWPVKSVDDPAAPDLTQAFYSAEELLPRMLVLSLSILLLVGCCLAVVLNAFEYRRLFNQHQILVEQRDELQVEWSQLLLEQSAWAANNRVEKQAEKHLAMIVPGIEQIEVVENER